MGPQQSKHTITVKKNQEIIPQPFPQAIVYINRNLSPSFSGLTMISSLAMMMSPRHLLRVTVGRPTLRLPVTQKCPPHRSTPSTTLRLLELLPCECSFIYVLIFSVSCLNVSQLTSGTTQTSIPRTQHRLRRGLTSPVPAHRVTTKWPQAPWDTKTRTLLPVTTPPLHLWPTRYTFGNCMENIIELAYLISPY